MQGKGIVHTKMKLSFTHPHFLTNLYEFAFISFICGTQNESLNVQAKVVGKTECPAEPGLLVFDDRGVLGTFIWETISN